MNKSIPLRKCIHEYQYSDPGMWRSSILDPNDPPNPETTGSSGILIGLAWGVNSGILERQTYQPVVEKAWEGLTHLAVQKSGLLGYCQPVGGSPKPVIDTRDHTCLIPINNVTYPHMAWPQAGPDSTSDFCVGLFLLAANEVQKMAPL